jgi:hypothetical protein
VPLRVLQLLVIDRAARDVEALHASFSLHLRHIDRFSWLGWRRCLLGSGAACTP